MEKVSDDIKISIIIPVYNGEKYIDVFLNKILNINVSKQIIVVNDCSTDNSLNILNKYKDKITLINLKSNKGASYARNMGLKKAIGKYIGFLDIDDQFENDIYEKMLNKIELEKADICICNYDEHYESKKQITLSKYKYKNMLMNKDEVIGNFLLDNISPAIWDKIYSKKILKDIFFDEKLLIGEDILFCLNVFLKCKNVVFIDEYLYHYLQQDNSLMHTVSPKLLHFKDVVKNIEEKDLEYLNTFYSDELNFFKLEMITRGIHSLSSLKNKNNVKQVKMYLKSYYIKKDLDNILKCNYFSVKIKFEIFILKYFGISVHLFLTPFYKWLRSILRK